MYNMAVTVVWMSMILLISVGDVSRADILFGQVSVFPPHPLGLLGSDFQKGLLIAFNETNDLQGGVGGHKLLLKSYNDNYNTIYSSYFANKLISEGAFALIGQFGAPTTEG